MRSRTWKIAMGLSVLSSGIALGQVTVRVSVTSGGAQANDSSAFSSISADGRYVAFNLTPSGVPWDVFVRDRLGGTTELVSIALDGTHGSGWCMYSSISADGRYVAFDSRASDLVPGDTNGTSDVFVRDRQTGTTERVSVNSSGIQGNDVSEIPSISADGRYVAFQSSASNLVAGDTNAARDIFVRDRQSGITSLVSVDSHGQQTYNQNGSNRPSISADGRYVAFDTAADLLLGWDTNLWPDIYVRDRQTGTTERVSIDSGGLQSNAGSGSASISADGRYVGFTSDATNLAPGDTNAWEDAFVHDRQTGTTERVSVDSLGAEGNLWSYGTSISADGRYVAFTSQATNLVPGDTNGTYDAFVRDRQSGVTSRISVDSFGAQGNGNSWAPSISADGRYTAFVSDATNLVPGDTNGLSDIFVRDGLGGPSFTSLCSPGVGRVVGCPCANPPIGSERGCDNSAATGGAALSASGATYLSSDSLVFTTSGQKPTATSVLLQGTSPAASGVAYGQGVRCVGGTLKRLFTKIATGGSITAPDFGAGDPAVSVRSAAKGNVIRPGQSRWYLVFYRDPIVLGGCPASRTFNVTQTGRVTWSP